MLESIDIKDMSDKEQTKHDMIQQEDIEKAQEMMGMEASVETVAYQDETAVPMHHDMNGVPHGESFDVSQSQDMLASTADADIDQTETILIIEHVEEENSQMIQDSSFAAPANESLEIQVDPDQASAQHEDLILQDILEEQLQEAPVSQAETSNDTLKLEELAMDSKSYVEHMGADDAVSNEDAEVETRELSIEINQVNDTSDLMGNGSLLVYLFSLLFINYRRNNRQRGRSCDA